jgi:HEAT repeat protein
MRPRPLLVVALALAAGAAAARADLDVGVPPGTPFDWVTALPRRIPTGAVRIATGGETSKDEGDGQPHTVSRAPDVPKAHINNEDLGRILPMGYARILTPDITRHLPWVNERPVMETFEDGKKSTTGGKDAKEGPVVQATYPPMVGEDLHWMGLAVLLRKLTHPNLISDAESVHLLIGMGEAVLPPLTAASQQGAIKHWIDEVRADVGAFPARRPHALGGARSPEEKMLLRLAAEDLASSYPCGLEGDFAPHLLALDPEETAPLLVRYLEESDHPFLRRNACSLLGNYLGDLPTNALVKVFLETKDGVIRERAIDALARRRSTAILPQLEKLAAQKGLPQTLALWAIGAIGEPKPAHLCVKALSRTDDPDVLWAAIPAVGRAQHEKPKDAITALRACARFLADAPGGTYEQPAQLQADVPDPPLLKATCLLEMALIALAKLGDDQARKDLWKLLDDEPSNAIPRSRRAAAHQAPVASKETFGALHVPCLVLLLETLPTLGEKGAARLEMIAKDTVCEVSLRLAALDGLASMKALKAPLLETLIDDTAFPAVRARALMHLYALDPALGITRSRKVLKEYGDSKVTTAGTDVVVAIRNIEADRTKKFPVKSMKKALVRAAKEALEKPTGGFVSGSERTIEMRPPILEEVLHALGTAQVESAVAPLVAHASDKANAARATAVTALAAYPQARETIVSLLSDDDGWVRYNAYRVLHRKAPAVDAFADWIYGPPADRAGAVAKWQDWLKAESAKKPEDGKPPAEPPKKGDAKDDDDDKE